MVINALFRLCLARIIFIPYVRLRWRWRRDVHQRDGHRRRLCRRIRARHGLVLVSWPRRVVFVRPAGGGIRYVKSFFLWMCCPNIAVLVLVYVALSLSLYCCIYDCCDTGGVFLILMIVFTSFGRAPTQTNIVAVQQSDTQESCLLCVLSGSYELIYSSTLVCSPLGCFRFACPSYTVVLT